MAVLGAVVGYAVSLLLPSQYAAQASLYLRDPGSPTVLSLGGSSQSQSGDHAVFMATQADLCGSDAVYGRALQLLNRDGTPDDLRRSVEVGPSADLASLTIRATSSDPSEAATLANAVGTACEQVAGERMAADCQERNHALAAGHGSTERRVRLSQSAGSRRRAVPLNPPSSARHCMWPI